MSDAITPEADASAAPEAITPEASASAKPEAAVATPPAPTTTAGPDEASGAEDNDAENKRENPRKVREGIVISTSMDKTAVVEATDRVRHRRYAKTVQRATKLFAHDENNDSNVGDRVRIEETRPLSKKKRWRLTEIIERAR